MIILDRHLTVDNGVVTLLECQTIAKEIFWRIEWQTPCQKSSIPYDNKEQAELHFKDIKKDF